jgi:hypothetical protein
LACAAFAVAALWQTSVPGLRHDWSWPIGNEDITSHIAESISGWSPLGFGRPYAFLTGCDLDPLTGVLNYIFGAHWSLMLFLFCIAVVIGTGAARIADAASPVVQTAFALIAIFNPWTFNELVAGHLPMLLSLGATLHLTAELRRETPRPFALSLAMIAAYVQTQFFVLDTVLLAFYARRVRSIAPYASTLIVALPTIIGILFSQFALSQIPLLRVWQISQSVPFWKAVLLGGYAFGYADSMPAFASYLVGLFVLVALAGIYGRKIYLGIPIITAILLLFISGLSGPTAPLYSFLLDHVRGVALFRELYDLVAFVLVAYLVLAARAVKNVPISSTIVVVLAPLFAIAWIAGAPSRYWFDVASLPKVEFNAPPDTRFALLPPFQPFSARGKGSGSDPDLFIRSDNVTPLNAYLPDYPSTFAFGDWLANGDARPLQSLSVSTVVSRPWLSTDDATLAHTFPVARMSTSANATQQATITALSALPEITFWGAPQTVDIPPQPWDNAIFFADLPSSTSVDFHVLHSSIDNADFSLGWVDARLLFASHPELSQGFGGVATASQQLFPVDAREQLLANVRGSLTDENGTVLAHDTPSLRWITLPRSTTGVRCHGTCLLIAQGEPPDIKVRTENDLSPPRAVGHTVLSWLMTATLPANATGALRLNVAFAPRWLALDGLNSLPHVRIDGVANGWLVSAAQKERRITILYLPALLQFCAEILGWLWLVVVVVKLVGARQLRS